MGLDSGSLRRNWRKQFPNRVPIVLVVRRGILAQRTRPKLVVGERDGGTVLLRAYRKPTQPEL
jgi:hypothetical protein